MASALPEPIFFNFDAPQFHHKYVFNNSKRCSYATGSAYFAVSLLMDQSITEVASVYWSIFVIWQLIQQGSTSYQ